MPSQASTPRRRPRSRNRRRMPIPRHPSPRVGHPDRGRPANDVVVRQRVARARDHHPGTRRGRIRIAEVRVDHDHPRCPLHRTRGCPGDARPTARAAAARAPTTLTREPDVMIHRPPSASVRSRQVPPGRHAEGDRSAGLPPGTSANNSSSRNCEPPGIRSRSQVAPEVLAAEGVVERRSDARTVAEAGRVRDDVLAWLPAQLGTSLPTAPSPRRNPDDDWRAEWDRSGRTAGVLP